MLQNDEEKTTKKKVSATRSRTQDLRRIRVTLYPLYRQFQAYKMTKSEKTKKHTFFWNAEFYIVAKFQVNCLKTENDEWRWAFLMSHTPTLKSRCCLTHLNSLTIAVMSWWHGSCLVLKMGLGRSRHLEEPISHFELIKCILGLHCHAMKNKSANHSIQKD